MAQMIDLDEKEDLEKIKSFIDYLATFINPQAVSSMKNMAKNTKTVSDKDFVKTLEMLSGHKIDESLLNFFNKG